MNRHVYAFAVWVDGRLRTVKTYGFSFREALAELQERLGVEPTAVVGIRIGKCTNRGRGK